MKSDKLVDAIGMIDDELISSALVSKRKPAFRHANALVAAIILIFLVPMAAGGFYTVSRMGCSASSGAGDNNATGSFGVSLDYELSLEKREILLSHIRDRDAEAPTEISGAEWGYVPDFPTILYADEERVIFDYMDMEDQIYGVFVYRYSAYTDDGFLEYAIDVSEIGDEDAADWSGVTIADDSGEHLYFVKLKDTPDDDGNYQEYYYVLDLESGEFRKSDAAEQNSVSWGWERHERNKLYVSDDATTYSPETVMIPLFLRSDQAYVCLALENNAPMKELRLLVTDAIYPDTKMEFEIFDE